ncbi:uncharacterized protein LOC124323580 [Daphnia pulicaria]|uniref:uncharacterized protein LOC124323580 n=1 Tax=Daphnia pulicaria TaxID=35523 RepID=UPI001EEBD542|nr:uncharacterized protein LOC124323580 [Daphnia pulicaria]
MYGKLEVLIEGHTHKLDTLQPVKYMADTTALRCFQLTIQSHINALETLGIARTSHEEAAERLSRLRAQTPKPAQNSQQPAKAAPATTLTASQLGISSKPTPQPKSLKQAGVDYEGLHTYLPHYPVYRTDKATTKIRQVFDGAAKSKYRPNLNDVLETGPNLNPNLLWVLMRFRMNRISWIADIEKAFLKIVPKPEDAEAVRFLWQREPEDPSFDLMAYKWKRVPLGLSSTPFLLRVSVNKHLLSVKSTFPETVEQIEKQLYVDDFLGGADDKTTAVTTVGETVTLFSEAQLNMRSWTTNNKQLRDFLTEKEMSNQFVGIPSLTIDGQPKALGLRWDTNSDKTIKRKVFSISARIFDPIGFLAPTTLLLKIIYQKLWEGEMGWDSRLEKYLA